MNDLINIFKVLSDETRLRIMMLLKAEDLCVCQLGGVLEVSQPNVSKHLGKLRDLGFVIDERREKFVYYSINKKNVMLEKVIEDVYSDLENYEKLSKDAEGLKYKDIFLANCGCNIK